MTVAETQLLLRSTSADWTFERWETLPDDGNLYEVIDGVLYMSTSPSAYHGWIVMRLIELVGLPAKNRGLVHVFTAPLGVLMPGCDPVQPDFFLIRQERENVIRDTKVREAPDLIAEILSPSNPEHDTRVKRGAYARAGVPEYWIVRPATRDVLVCWNPDAVLGDYTQTRLVGPDDELEAATLPIQVSVHELFTGAPDSTL
jgi:Uma2 family endonuclease